jgi:hypothetical protein
MKRSFISCALTISCTSFAILSMIGFGTPLGASRPIQEIEK